MKVVHIVENYSILSGGVRTVVRNLHLELLANMHNSIVMTPFYEERDENVVEIPIKRFNPWMYSKKIKPILEQINRESKIDVIHIHGVWMHPQYFASKFALKHNIPFVVSFHGMYEPWLWKKGYWKKTVYTKLLTNRLFCKASVIHSITNSETTDLKRRFKKATVVEIPNLINTKIVTKTGLKKESSDYILFLGRLDPIKGINLLIDAFALLKDKYEVKLKIAGPINQYQQELEKQVETLEISDRVEFLGVVKGVEKQILFENAQVFIAPSFSEVIGMVNLEAALFGTVVITSHTTGLSKDWCTNGGFLINPNVTEIKESLETALDWDDQTRENKGNQLKEFVKKEYSWEHRYSDWEKLYNSIKR